MPDSFAIDGRPFPRHAPASIAEAVELVRGQIAAGLAVYPVGGGTMLGIAGLPTRDGIVLDTRSIAHIDDYPARDMTITVGAGISMATLAEVLAKEGQRLPVDVPAPERSTLGGAIAANLSGSRRYGFGTLRDYVIGIRWINDRGEDVRAGGRVVKNVAGYDMMKLLVGSLGTLGVVTEVTLKVKPIPEASRLMEVRCKPAELDGILTILHGSRTRPASIDALKAPQETDWLIRVGLEDNRLAVEWSMDRLRSELAGFDLTEIPIADTAAMWKRMADFPLSGPGPLWKATRLPSRTAEFLCLAADGRTRIAAHAGNGIVLGLLPETATTEEVRAISTALAPQSGTPGSLSWVRLSPEIKAAWKNRTTERDGDRDMMARVEAALDPRGLMSPRRG